MNFKDYYSILGVLPQATQKEIAAAYKAMAKKWHPDTNKGTDTTHQMQLISEAYGVLKSTDKRKTYNIEYYKYFQSRIQSHQKTEVKIERCYYCNKNIANEKFSNRESLYKETKRTYFPQRKVWYKTVNINIPRCEECYKTHSSSSSIFILLPLISFTVLGLILGLTIWGNWVLGIFAGIIVGIMLGYGLSLIDKSIIAKEAGIRKESDIADFPLVTDLKKDGWTKDQPTA